MNDLTMIVPSRGRPLAADKVRESFNRTTGADSRLVFALDADDGTWLAYPPIKFQSKSDSTVSALNNCALKYMNESRYLGFIGDDCRFITAGWDKTMISAADEMGSGIVYANDLMDPGALPTSMLISSSIVKSLGWMAPPLLKAICFDDYWLRLGQGLDRIKYLDDVVIQHISLPNLNPKPNNDFAIWAAWQRERMSIDIEKARACV